MSWRNALPPSFRQCLLYCVLALAVAALATTALLARLSVRDQLHEQHLTAEHLGALVVRPAAVLPDDSTEGRGQFLRQVADHPSLAALTIFDDAGNTAFAYVRETEPPHWFVRSVVTEPERRARQSFGNGTLEFALSYGPLNETAERALLAGSALTAALVVAVLLLANGLVRRVLAPLQRMTVWLRQAARGRWKPGPPGAGTRFREVLDLGQALAEGAANVRHHLQRLEETQDLLAHSDQRLQEVVGSLREALFELDPGGRLRFVNAAWQQLTGFAAEQALDRPFADFLRDDDIKQVFEPDRLAAIEIPDSPVAARHISGRPLWIRLTARPRLDASGRLNGVFGNFADVTEQVELNNQLARYQQELYQLAVLDPLTGLYNRRHFDRQLAAILDAHLPLTQPVCLMLLGLDGFKSINDTYGHPAGDEVLRATARLLRAQVRRHDYVARVAGDEFAVVLKNTDLTMATAIARKLHAQLSETRVPLPVGALQLQSSVGVAEAPTHGSSASELISAADVALYHSKRGGRNRVEALSPDTSNAVMSVFTQGFRLRHALEQGWLYPAFQPIYDLRTGRRVAFEVLARMRLDDKVVAAKDFIAVAEELGLTRDVDLHIIGRALKLTPPGEALFLNVDLSSFNDRGFVHELKELLGPARQAGRAITIEVTERETVPISDTLLDDIRSLRELGCKLALDDFGSGYSTYHFLNEFRPDYLKIEGTFVRTMLENEAARKIVTHIHELAQSFGMETIAESVETEAIRTALEQIGIRNVQGHLYGEPLLAA